MISYVIIILGLAQHTARFKVLQICVLFGVIPIGFTEERTLHYPHHMYRYVTFGPNFCYQCINSTTCPG